MEPKMLEPNERCIVPPAGWSCSRQNGHEGPCAAVPDALTRAAAIPVTFDAKGKKSTRKLLWRSRERLSTFVQTRKDRQALKRFWKQQHARTPHDLVLVIASILDRHPDVRKAFKDALRLR